MRLSGYVSGPHRFFISIMSKSDFTLLSISQYSATETGGAERYINEINQQLSTLGFSITQISTDAIDPIFNELTLKPSIRVLSSGYNPAWYKQLDHVIDVINPDCLLCHFTVPALVDVAARVASRKQLPLAMVYHSDITGASLSLKLIGRIYDRFVGQSTINRVNHLFVSSQLYMERSRLLQNYTGPLSIAPPGVSKSLLSSISHENDPSEPYFLFVGKPMNPNKGFKILVKAWREVYRKKGVRLKIVGDCSNLSLRCREDGCDFLGFISSPSHLASLYHGAVATVLPSIANESFGMVLAESLVCGTPVIGSDIGGVPAVVRHGFNGYSVEPENADVLSKFLFHALRNQQKLREQIATVDYQQEFSWQRTAQTIAEQLRRLASGY